MPYRRGYSRRTRKFTRKKSYRSKWSKKRATKKASNRVLCKVKHTALAITSSSVITFNVSMTDCLNGISNGSTPNTDFSRYLELYDMFRPCGVKIQVIPYYNTNTVLAGPTPQLYAPIYSCGDYTDMNNATSKSIGDIIEYNNVKFHNTYRPFKRYFKLKKFSPDGGEWGSAVKSYMASPGYFNTDNYTQVTAAGNMPGVVYFTSQNANTPGRDLQILVTWYYAFKNRN